jgi:hypothetical protein
MSRNRAKILRIRNIWRSIEMPVVVVVNIDTKFSCFKWAKKENGSLEVVPIYSDENSFKLSRTLCKGIASGIRAVVRIHLYSNENSCRESCTLCKGISSGNRPVVRIYFSCLELT